MSDSNILPGPCRTVHNLHWPLPLAEVPGPGDPGHLATQADHLDRQDVLHCMGILQIICK